MIDIGHLLIHSADIERYIRTDDGRGGWDEEWKTVAQNVPCRAQPLNAAEQAKYASLQMEVDAKIYFESLAVPMLTGPDAIDEKDLISVNSHRYEIIGLYDTDLLNKVCVATCIEIRK